MRSDRALAGLGPQSARSRLLPRRFPSECWGPCPPTTRISVGNDQPRAPREVVRS